MKKIALIGGKITNSPSVSIHSFFFKQHNIQGQYKIFSVTRSQLEPTVKKLIASGYRGFNVTTPYKETIISLLDSLDETAAKIGAVNTVLINDGKLIGYNTDSYGFIQGLKSQLPNFKFQDLVTLVLGAGGAARAILYALNAEGGKKIYLSNRTFAKAEKLAQIFSNVVSINWGQKEAVLNGCDLVVNCTSVISNFINLANLPPHAVVNDIIYLPTDLLKQAGAVGVGGLGMLMWQAKLAFRIWFEI